MAWSMATRRTPSRGVTLTTVPATSHAGSYAITASGASDPIIISLVNGTLTVDPAALTISANDQNMVYGGTMPTLTASYNGLANGDTTSCHQRLTLTTPFRPRAMPAATPSPPAAPAIPTTRSHSSTAP